MLMCGNTRSYVELKSNSNTFELERREASPLLHLVSHLHHSWKKVHKRHHTTTATTRTRIHLPFHSHPSTSLPPIAATNPPSWPPSRRTPRTTPRTGPRT